MDCAGDCNMNLFILSMADVRINDNVFLAEIQSSLGKLTHYCSLLPSPEKHMIGPSLFSAFKILLLSGKKTVMRLVLLSFQPL